MQKTTPVALFTYNRPEHTQKTLESLSRCHRLDEFSFFFFSDGPRIKEHVKSVSQTRSILRNFCPRFKAEIIEHKENQGLLKSITSGVEKLCNQFNRVIVVEDDLILREDFLHFMLESLDYYEPMDQVMQVGGYPLCPPEALQTDAFLLPVTTTWGWATWKRAWDHFSLEPKNLEAARNDPDWLQLFDLNGTCSYSMMLNNRLAGKNDSWGILWWYAVSRRKGLTVYPRQQLVLNSGFDGSGVHCDNLSTCNQQTNFSTKVNTLHNKLRFPETTTFNEEHLAILEDYHRSQASGKRAGNIVKRQNSLFSILLNTLKKITT